MDRLGMSSLNPPGRSRDQVIAEEGHKDDDGKTRWDVIPWEAVEEMAQVMSFGAKKYAAYNFRKGMARGRLFSAAIRHLYQWQRGEEVDSESGLSHLSHAACCVLMLRDLEILGVGEDTRYKVQ